MFLASCLAIAAAIAYEVVVEAQISAPVPKTGQATSFIAGDDGDLRKGINWPVPRFIDNLNGTITDNLTGLMWLKEGNCISTFTSDFDFDGTAGDGQVTWQHALDFIEQLNAGTYNCNAPSHDWRLPNVRELASLHSLENYNPALPGGHPFSNAGGWYWSSTSLMSFPGETYAWVMPSAVGSALCREKTEHYGVWAVRGPVSAGPAPVPKTGQSTCSAENGQTIDCPGTGQDGEFQFGVAWPSPRFSDNADGTVTDRLTGLVWLKDAHCFLSNNWGNTLSNCRNLQDGQCGLSDGSVVGDWRMPNANELFSLLDMGRSTTPPLPAGHPFVNVLKYQYWTNSRSPQAFQTYAFFVHMHEAQLSASGLFSAGYNAWPVRDGPVLPLLFRSFLPLTIR
jgi:hypothetical protein